jgi:YVTN family beta-propeller protein
MITIPRLLTALLYLVIITCNAQSLKEIEAKRVTLPNGWGITAIGKTIPLGDLPLNIAVSKSKKLLAVTNNGQSDQTIQLIDAVKQTVIDTILVGKAWVGLTFSNDEQSLYASGGNDNWIVRFSIKDKKLVPQDTFVLGGIKEKISPAGIAVDDAQKKLYVVTKEDNSLYVIDLTSKKTASKFPLGGEGYTCMLSPDCKFLYITCWGCDKVEIFDAVKQEFSGSIPVGDNPNDLCFTTDGKFLFVANANDNSVSVIDVQKRKVLETLNAALYPNAPSGSTTNGVALSADNKTLYIANADNNCLAVFDVSLPGSCKSKGFIPTGWYPTCVRVVNKKLFIANGKGYSSMANPYGPNPLEKKSKVIYQGGDPNKPTKVQYIAGLLRGKMNIIGEPDEEQLSVYSQVVYHNTPYTKELENTAKGQEGNPIPYKTGSTSPIKHVFYIIKENRTYDQVLGDITGGNGDTSLVLFGYKVTPNQHAVARDFVLLDNFYVDGEVSADGHNWSTAAYATDYLEKTWPTSYGGRGGSYDAEGNREIANSKNGFIWDLCKKYGVTYRTYGEFADDYKPNIPALKDHFCPYYTSWDQTVRDTTRFNQWKRDFDSLLAINKLPQLNTLRFINDHTEGLRAGRPSPAAHVADNDLAVGLFIDYLSHSPVWKESVVFILEDDAQNGADHVDAHRSTAYVAGGFVKRQFIDHTMYSTSSVLRTMELILGLPPMSQYDAAATPLWRCFTDTADTKPFKALPPETDITELNTAMNKWQQMSEQFDFRAEDRAPDLQLNEVLWVAMKGEKQSCPAPVHAAFVKLRDNDD